MSSIIRKNAVANIAARTPDLETASSANISEIYGENAFTLKTMKKVLPKAIYKKLRETIKKGKILDSDIADVVAGAMKNWAIAKGATHYTHWFQPLTGSTAEKHDSFIDPDGEGGVILNFSGKELVQGEPDASSFPSGGIRATFEARGYTAWDPTSPAFLKKSKAGATFCIPTAFCSYTGEALDKKTPLLRSMQAISKQAKRVLKCFGKDSDGMALTTLGAEQEYFLIDKELFLARPDLVQAGRTLFGNVPPKHQQMDDHYFGAIKARIIACMEEVDKELWKLGIPAKTRHNEVAPAEFEIACVYETLNLATDHNMMVMEILRAVADRHGLVALLHEKPFAGINGNGKHNNWSIASPDGKNLLEPGKTPHDNAMFLTFICSIIKAVDSHADLLRATVATAGNDHRLGANEAPPAIVSIFLGEQLTDIIKQIEKGGAKSSKTQDILNIGVDALPNLPKDVTDRNRTSPFAFTGNKFEFRAVGSQQSCSGPNVVLNTAIAEALDEIATKLEKVKKADFNKTLQKILSDIIKKHKKVLFNGDGYTAEWLNEAEKRGLPNLKKTPEALKSLVSKKAVSLFEKYDVLSKTEILSRYEVYQEQYDMVIDVEAKLTSDIAKTILLPVALEQLAELADTVAALADIGVKAGQAAAKTKITKIGKLVDEATKAVAALDKAIAAGSSANMIKFMDAVRVSCDGLELEVDDDKWPLPKYSELLFAY
ncbi:MAG: glutamine synthetase type III [Chlamydiae bacterium]|nr:MAG: glutamine synthetase type III [Chlamydiota bacterium]